MRARTTLSATVLAASLAVGAVAVAVPAHAAAQPATNGTAAVSVQSSAAETWSHWGVHEGKKACKNAGKAMKNEGSITAYQCVKNPVDGRFYDLFVVWV